jgi:hypothetical protein
MSEKQKAPAVIVPVEHQSAPKEHPADRAIMQAAEEIDSGRYKPPTDILEHMPNVALRTGTPEMLEKPVTRADYAHTENTIILAEHPRVKEALARLAQERDDAPTSQEYVEKALMLHELNEMQRSGQKWEGQERWEGAENEDERRGRILTPLEFYVQLMRVMNPGGQFAHHSFMVGKRLIRAIGVPPLLLGREAQLQHPELPASSQSGRVPLFVVGRQRVEILLPGQPDTAKEEPIAVAMLQWPANTEWMMLNFDQFGVPTTAKFIGWRTALLALIRAGIISEKQAHKAFPVGSGPAASWYRQQLRDWRNQRPAGNA